MHNSISNNVFLVILFNSGINAKNQDDIIIFDKTSYRKISLNIFDETKKCEIFPEKNLLELFPPESQDLADGPILHYYDIKDGYLFLVFPRTGGVFIIKYKNDIIQCELVGRVMDQIFDTIGFFGFFESKKFQLRLFTAQQIYKIKPEEPENEYTVESTIVFFYFLIKKI